MSPRYTFVLASLRGAPPDGGVYVLWLDEVTLYIGHVTANGHSINSRLMQHYLCERQPADATHFSWEICRDPAARAIELIRQHQAQHQKAPRWNDAIA